MSIWRNQKRGDHAEWESTQGLRLALLLDDKDGASEWLDHLHSWDRRAAPSLAERLAQSALKQSLPQDAWTRCRPQVGHRNQDSRKLTCSRLFDLNEKLLFRRGLDVPRCC